MNFVYEDTKIVIKDPTITVASGVLVYNAKDDTKTPLTKLEFSDMTLGLKPVTGESDAETNIPSTVTDKNGSEGVYSKIKITAAAGLKIVVKNIVIDSPEDPADIAEERENLFVAIKDVPDSAYNLKEDVITLATFSDAQEDAEYTFLFWLDGKAGDILKGCTICFEISFEY